MPLRLLTITLLLAIMPGGSGGYGSAASGGESSSHVGLGIYVGSPESEHLLRRYAHVVERAPVIVGVYRRWPRSPFPRRELAKIWHRGSVPMITWEPWTRAGRPFSLRAIAGGRYDAYLRRSARAAVAWRHRVFVRFAPDMNGSRYPWAVGRSGNSAALYKRAWRHVVGIFRRAGADKVLWAWTASAEAGRRSAFRRLYPGDAWVNWVGLDGFNWGQKGGWRSFTSIFGRSYNALTRLTARPVMIAETGSGEGGGSKTAWMTSAMWHEIPGFSHLRAVVWVDESRDGVDLSVDSSRAAWRALAGPAAVASRYALTRLELLATPPRLSSHTLAPEAPTAGYGEQPPLTRLFHKLHGRDLWYAIAIGAALLAAALALARFFWRRLPAA